MSSAEILSLKGVMALEAMAGVAPVCQVQTLRLVEHLRLDRALATRGADPHEARCADEDDERHPRAALATAAGRRGRTPGTRSARRQFPQAARDCQARTWCVSSPTWRGRFETAPP